MSEEQKDSQQPTLTEFIEKNHKLISTAGVLATLAVLASKLPENQLGIMGKFLSFVLFVLVLIICLEIFGNFPWTEKGKLYWFREGFSMAVFGFGMVWVLTFYPFLLVGLLMLVVLSAASLIFALCALGIRKLVLRIPWLTRLKQRTKERTIPLFGTMVLMTVGFVILRYFKLFWHR
jgi:hypothetical protein